MTYPRVTVNLNTIRDNVRSVIKLIGKDIGIAGVTKVFCGNPDIAKAYIDGGVTYLADSRIENLKRLKDLDTAKIMLRLPMISEAGDIVEYADISLNSEIETIKALSEKALDKGIEHKILLMVDLGDLREGYFHEGDLFEAVEEIIKLKGIKLAGLGTNLTCYGGVIPTKEHMEKLARLKKEIENRFNLELEILSGGNSSSIHLLSNYKPESVNNLRLGESLVLGTEAAYGKQLEGTRNDGFILQVQIIEVKEKPSVPTGEIGRDAFGKVPTFVDRGVRKRIICAVGKQDIDFDTLYPLDDGIVIFGGSSDHLILDGTNSKIDYKVGDIVEFRMHYVSILRSMTSEYIEKELIY
ncbi:MAG: ornithine racemase Orr [Tissierellaceae bacterium]